MWGMDAEEKEYRVVYHDRARALMGAAVDGLLAGGWRTSEIVQLVSDIENRLRKDPHGFGEPHYSIRAIALKVSVGFVGPLSIEIGIHEAMRIVFVRRVTLMNTMKD
jgi:hypothetical protein